MSTRHTRSGSPERKKMKLMIKLAAAGETKKSGTTIQNLSNDLLMDIMSRLQVKHVMISRCVCNPWRTLLLSNRFIDLHFNRSKLRDPHILARNNENFAFNFGIIDCEFAYRPVDLKLASPYITVIGSCNGLVCLSDLKDIMYFWNPSTGERVDIQFPTMFCKDSDHDIGMGFGYCPIMKEYKVVRVVYVYSKFIEAKVYALATNSWKTLEDLPSHHFYSTDYICRSAHLNGVMHWDGVVSPLSKEEKQIVSFDLRTEKFGRLSYPAFDEGRYMKSLWTWEGCLAVSCYYKNERVDFWVMKEYGVQESWNKIFSLQPSSVGRAFGLLQPLALLKNDKILLQRDCISLLEYDPKNRRGRIPVTRGGKPSNFHATTYMEALTSIGSLMSRASGEGQ